MGFMSSYGIYFLTFSSFSGRSIHFYLLRLLIELFVLTTFVLISGPFLHLHRYLTFCGFWLYLQKGNFDFVYVTVFHCAETFAGFVFALCLL